MNWSLSVSTFPVLVLIGLAVACFHSKHRGSLAHGLRVAVELEKTFSSSADEFPHLQQIFAQNPCLEKPTLWFTPYKAKHHSFYPEHVRDAVRTVFLSLRRLSQTGVIPYIPTEIILIILSFAGNESVALGKAPPLIGKNDSFFGTVLFDWASHRSRITRHGSRHASIWNMS